jgi:RES domain-containing protein
MITAYRLVQKRWVSSAFDGEGSRLYRGRWNSAGNRCVYVASAESLAILEILVHTEDTAILNNYALLTIEFNESDLLTVELDDLPTNWAENPAPEESAVLGDGWLASKASLALELPSTVVPREKNYLINIEHPAFEKALSTVKELEFAFDARLTQ